MLFFHAATRLCLGSMRGFGQNIHTSLSKEVWDSCVPIEELLGIVFLRTHPIIASYFHFPLRNNSNIIYILGRALSTAVKLPSILIQDFSLGFASSSTNSIRCHFPILGVCLTASPFCQLASPVAFIWWVTISWPSSRHLPLWFSRPSYIDFKNFFIDHSKPNHPMSPPFSLHRFFLDPCILALLSPSLIQWEQNRPFLTGWTWKLIDSSFPTLHASVTPTSPARVPVSSKLGESPFPAFTCVLVSCFQNGMYDSF